MSCPVCLSPATTPALTGSDLLFESTSKSFRLDSCNQCRCLFLSPMPDAHEIATFYPNQYWWNSSKRGLLKRAEALYRKVALHGHVSFIVRVAETPERLNLLD